MFLTFTNRTPIPAPSDWPVTAYLALRSVDTLEGDFFPLPTPFRIRALTVVSAGHSADGEEIPQPHASIRVELLLMNERGGMRAVPGVTLDHYGPSPGFPGRWTWAPKRVYFDDVVCSEPDLAFVALKVTVSKEVLFALPQDHLQASLRLETNKQVIADIARVSSASGSSWRTYLGDPRRCNPIGA